MTSFEEDLHELMKKHEIVSMQYIAKMNNRWEKHMIVFEDNFHRMMDQVMRSRKPAVAGVTIGDAINLMDIEAKAKPMPKQRGFRLLDYF